MKLRFCGALCRTIATVLIPAIVPVLLAASSPATAQSIKIVALGASVANGKGVGTAQAWPALLESTLRAKGYNVSVTVSANDGDTSDRILARADAAASGARVVVFDNGSSNDRERGVSESQLTANTKQTWSHIRAQGAVPIRLEYSNLPKLPDGIHLSPQGHAMVAARVAPQVIAAIGKRK